MENPKTDWSKKIPMITLWVKLKFEGIFNYIKINSEKNSFLFLVSQGSKQKAAKPVL